MLFEQLSTVKGIKEEEWKLYFKYPDFVELEFFKNDTNGKEAIDYVACNIYKEVLEVKVVDYKDLYVMSPYVIVFK